MRIHAEKQFIAEQQQKLLLVYAQVQVLFSLGSGKLFHYKEI